MQRKRLRFFLNTREVTMTYRRVGYFVSILKHSCLEE